MARKPYRGYESSAEQPPEQPEQQSEQAYEPEQDAGIPAGGNKPGKPGPSDATRKSAL